MSKESKIILIALLFAFLAVFVAVVAVHRDLVEEIRVGDGHVSSAVHQHNSGALEN